VFLTTLGVAAWPNKGLQAADVVVKKPLGRIVNLVAGRIPEEVRALGIDEALPVRTAEAAVQPGAPTIRNVARPGDQSVDGHSKREIDDHLELLGGPKAATVRQSRWGIVPRQQMHRCRPVRRAASSALSCRREDMLRGHRASAEPKGQPCSQHAISSTMMVLHKKWFMLKSARGSASGRSATESHSTLHHRADARPTSAGRRPIA
jgi:hypothetical protein